MAKTREQIPTLKQLQAIVNKFNLTYPVGTPVVLRKDSGEINTVVTGAAIVFAGASAVALFQGVSSFYSIEDNRVRRRLGDAA